MDPNQLLLFELGELEQLIEEAAQAEETQPDQNAATKPAARQKRKHSRRIIPDNLPTEEIVHELPEAERLCPIDGKPMPVIRYEISEQLDNDHRGSRGSSTREPCMRVRRSMTRRNSFISDSEWNLIKDLFENPDASTKGGRPRIDARACLERICWILKNGGRWEDLPERYPSTSTCWRRHK